MELGIVGSEGAKFTSLTEELARGQIRRLIDAFTADPSDHLTLVSGGCHLGGIDLWVEEEGRALDVPVIVHRPANLQWSTGYKPRNIRIAEDSKRVVCITVRELPSTYKGMTFPLCYHCGTKDHVKSGGCWTVKYAKKIGKEGEIIVVG